MADGTRVRRLSWVEAATVAPGDPDDDPTGATSVEPWPADGRRRRLLVVGTSTMGWKTCLDELEAVAATWDDLDTVILEVGSGPVAPANATPVRKAQLRHAITTASWRVRRNRRRAMMSLIERAECALFVNPNPALGILPDLERMAVPIGVYLDATVRNHALQSGWSPNLAYRVELGLQQRLVARSQVVGCMSQWAAHTVEHDLRGAGKVVVVPPSIAPRGDSVSAPHDGPLRLIFVGNPWLRKGADRLVDWLEARPNAHVQLSLYSEPPAKQELPDDRRIVRVGTADRGEVLGALTGSDCLVCPTRLDQSAFVIVEAAMAGTPAVAPRIGGLAELVDDGATGFLFGPHHDDDLWRVLDTLVAEPQLARSLREQTATAARSRFSSTNYRALVDALLSVTR